MAYGVTTYILSTYGVGDDIFDGGGGTVSIELVTPSLEVASAAPRVRLKPLTPAVEVGMLSFEGAFLGQILLPSGRTVLEHLETDRNLLPAPAP